MGGSKTLPEPMRKFVHEKFLAVLDERWPKKPGSKSRVETQERIGELLVAGSGLDPIGQTQLSEIEKHGTSIGVTFLLALSHFTGESINDLLGPSAPAVRVSGVGINDLAAEALYAAISFLEMAEGKVAFKGQLHVRFHAMREAVRRAQDKAQIEAHIATSAALAIDRVQRATSSFALAAEQTSKAARVADHAVSQLVRKVG